MLLFLGIGSVGLYYAIKRPSVQTKLVHLAASYASDYLGATVQIDKTSIQFFDKLQLEHVLIKDQQSDTLLYAKQVYVDLNLSRYLTSDIVELEDIALEDVYLKIRKNTKNPNYNFQFIVDKLQSSDSTPSKIQVLLHTIGLKRSTVYYHDEISKNKGLVKWEDLYVEIAQLPTKKNQTIAVKSIKLSEPKVVFHYTITKDSAVVDAKKDTTNRYASFPVISIQEFILENGLVKADNLLKKPIYKVFDANHIVLKKIETTVRDIYFSADSSTALLENLAVIDKNNFELKELTGNISNVGGALAISDFKLKTTKSTIENSVKMRYGDAGNFSDFVHKVYLEANLKNSVVHGDDLHYFIPSLVDFKNQQVEIDGKVSGTVANLRGEKIHIVLNKKSFLDGNFVLRGLPNLKQTLISLKLDNLQTSYTNVKKAVPLLKIPEEFKQLGNIKFKGSFDGFLNDFVAKGILVSELGGAVCDLNLKYNEQKKYSDYKGNMLLKNFNLGKLIGNPTILNNVNFDLNVDGNGHTLDKLNTTLKGNISSIDFNNYTYQNIFVDGKIVEKNFDGAIKINDPNLQANIFGNLFLDDKNPKLKVDGVVQKIALKPLGFSSKDWVVSSKIELNSVGKNIDDVVGAIALDSLQVQDNETNKKYALNYITFNAVKVKEGKSIELESEFLNANFVGKYVVKDLPVVINNYILKYLDKTYQTADRIADDANFNFDIQVKNIEKITQLFVPDLKELNGAVIKGNFNSALQKMEINGDVKHLKYGSFTADNISINGASSTENFTTNLSIDSILSKDSLILKPFTVKLFNELDKIQFQVSANKKTDANYLNLFGFLTNSAESFKIKFTPSDIIVNNQMWQIDSTNESEFSKKKFIIQNLGLYSDNQKVYAHSIHTINDSTNGVVLDFNHVDIAKLVPSLKTSSTKLQGQLHGNIEVKNIFKNPTPVGNVRLTEFVVNKDTIGDIQVSSKYVSSENRIYVDGNITGIYQDIDVHGYYVPNKKKDELHFDISINRFTANVLDNFITRYVYNSVGTATANLKLEGSSDKPILTGSVNVKDVETTVNFLHTRYKLKNQIIRIVENGIVIDGITILDKYNNAAYGGGMIKHNYFKDFYLDLYVNTKKFQCLNTDFSQNQTFYGNGIVEALATFKGYTRDFIKIQLTGKTLAGTYITLPFTNVQETGQYSFYKFVKKDAKKEDKTNSKFEVKNTGVDLDLNLEVLPEAKLDIIFSKETQDIIRSFGAGNIKIGLKPDGDFSVMGNYQVQKGSYLFTFQKVVNKEFVIKPGGTMTFVGDPTQAIVNIDAIYKLRVSAVDLIRDYLTEDQIAEAQRTRLPVNLYLSLRNLLMKPDIAFDLDFQTYDLETQNAIETAMQNIRSNENELNRQVFGLLVLNRFVPTYSKTTQGVNVNPLTIKSNDVVNTMSEFLSYQLSTYLSDWISSFVTDIDFGVKYRNYDETNSTTSTTELRRELQLALSKKLLNQRLIVNLGGNFDFGTSADNAQAAARKNNYVGGDLEVEYLITEDGRLRVKAFSRGQYDAFNNTNRNRTGMAISYKQEFEDWHDLVETERSKRKRKNKKQQVKK